MVRLNQVTATNLYFQGVNRPAEKPASSKDVSFEAGKMQQLLEMVFPPAKKKRQELEYTAKNETSQLAGLVGDIFTHPIALVSDKSKPVAKIAQVELPSIQQPLVTDTKANALNVLA